MYIAFSLVCILFVFDVEQISATCTCIRCAVRRRLEKRARTKRRMRNAVEIGDAGLLASTKDERSIRFAS